MESAREIKILLFKQKMQINLNCIKWPLYFFCVNVVCLTKEEIKYYN